jgi:Flp pilus assembly protein TadD
MNSVVHLALAHPRRLVALVAVLLYANTVHNAPVLDDNWVIFDNSLIKSLNNVPAMFAQPYNFALPGTNAGVYRPVTMLSYAINYDMDGPNVLGYHVGNMLLHALCCVLLFELATLLWSASGTASVGPLLGALLFAVHPVHVEAVTGLVGRAELLAAAGALGCLCLACTRQRARWRYPAALAALAAGVLSKENAAVTPLLFGLIAVTVPTAAGLQARPGFHSPAARRSLAHVTLLAGGMACTAALYFVLRPAAGGVPLQSQWFAGQPVHVVFNTMTQVVAEYWRLLVWPFPLGLDFYYSSRIPNALTFTPTCLFDTLAWLAVLGLGIVLLRRAPVVGAGILWVFIALLPALNIVPIGVLMAERLLYLPSAGFCMAAGVGVAAALAAVRHGPGVAPFAVPARVAMVLVGLALGTQTWRRDAAWRDESTLWEAEVRKEPADPVVNNNLARVYIARGDLQRAVERLTVALRVAPFYWQAQANMGLVAHKLGDDSAAIRWLTSARQVAPSESDPYYLLAIVLGDLGRFTEAVELLSQAESLAPAAAWLHLYRGRYLLQLKRTAEATAELKRAVELDPALAQ